ncbi:MAG: VWA domain-containing protein [Rhizobiaceae bacterium]
MERMRLPAIFLLLFALVFPAAATERTIIVLDASGSMWGQIEGQAKIEIARQTLSVVLGTIPADTELGLMVYGHREKGSCGDIELAVPPAAGSADAIASFVNAVNPKGKTPLSQSVRLAAEALRYTEEKSTVILVTDGIETCEADPCALGAELEKSGVDFTAHVVGFGLTDEEGRQVACLAENTGGKYLEAKDAGQLEGALAEAVAPAPAPEPKVEQPAELEFNVTARSYLTAGMPIPADNSNVYWEFRAIDAAGNRAENTTHYAYGGEYRFKLPAGRYAALSRLGRIERQQEIEAKAGEMSEIETVFDAGLVRLSASYVAGGAKAGTEAYVEIVSGGDNDYGYGAIAAYAPAGPVDLVGRVGKAEGREQRELKAGETIEHTVVIPAGLVVAHANYAEGGPAVEGSDVFLDIVSAKASISGERESFAYTYGGGNDLWVPAGEFLLKARLGKADAELPIVVGAGERVEPVINLNAGVLAIAAPGAYRIDIVSAKKDINGKQAELSGGYGDAFSETLHPGDYEVRVTYEGDKAPKSATATVKAGERTETRVE